MKNYINLTFILLLIISITGCEDNYQSLGLDLQEELLGTHFSDTVSLNAYAIIDDSLNTTKLSNNIIGFIHDPVFGTTQATIYAQFLLSGSSVNFGSNPQLDSVVLTLQCSGYFGDTLSAMRLNVYELTEDLSASTTYYSHSTTAHGDNITYQNNFSFFPRPTTSTTIDTSTINPHFSIRLSNAFGQKFIDNPSNLSSDDALLSLFKGICIEAEPTNVQTGCLLYSNLSSSLTTITLYYTNDNGTNKYNFSCKSSAVRYNNYTHNYTASSDPIFTAQVLQNDTLLGNKKLYIQATGGVKTKIQFPNLKTTFKDQNVVINKAELVISNISEDETFFFQPYSLSIQAIRNNLPLGYIPDDEVYTSTEYFGGIYNETKKEYRFRMTEYIQDQILGESNITGIYVVVKGAGVRGNRLVLAGSNPDLQYQDDRIRLELSYTTY